MAAVFATGRLWFKVLRAGLVEQFMEAGAIVESPCCGPCMGGSFGLLGDGEGVTGCWWFDYRKLSKININFCYDHLS